MMACMEQNSINAQVRTRGYLAQVGVDTMTTQGHNYI